jgi:hypothetical protein
MLGRNKRGCQGCGRLKHETDDEDHANACGNIAMILNNKLMTQIWHGLAARAWSLATYSSAHFLKIALLGMFFKFLLFSF